MAYLGKNPNPNYSNRNSNSNYVRPKRYTFFSDGTSYTFNSLKHTNFNGKYISFLDLHISEVKHRNSKSVFLLDEYGNRVKV